MGLRTVPVAIPYLDERQNIMERTAMATTFDYPCLIIGLSDSEDNSKVAITTPELHLCRKAEIHGESGVELELMTVHRGKHACITRRGDTFILTNLGKEHSIRIHEKELRPGMSYELYHGDVFWLPDPTAFPGQSFYNIMFLSDPDMTAKTTFHLNAGRVFVYNKPIDLAPKEYDIVRYLYVNRPNICARHEIIAAVWPKTKGDSYEIELHEDRLHTHLNKIRGKIREATGNRFTFMEHVYGQGLRLLI